MATKTQESRPVKLKVRTLKELKKIGYFQESYDDVVWRLLGKEKDKLKNEPPSKYEDQL